jgi:hypothetical protein
MGLESACQLTVETIAQPQTKNNRLFEKNFRGTSAALSGGAKRAVALPMRYTVHVFACQANASPAWQ